MPTTASSRAASATALALLLVLMLVATARPASALDRSSIEAEFVELINSERSSRGIAPLRVADDLVSVARSHSADMSSSGNLHHNPNLGSDVGNWRRLAENVGVGGGVTSLHGAFMNSSGHRANILDAQVTQIGVGVVQDGGRVWVTELFRLPVTSSTPSSPAPSKSHVEPLTGDWDGDGVVTPGWFVDGRFTLSNRRDGGGTKIIFTYGTPDDLPIVGDWDGNGTDTVGVVRDGTWHLVNAHRGGRSDIAFTYGRVSRGDIPLAGDWNGDGTDTAGIVRDGTWHLVNAHRGGPSDVSFDYGRVTRGDIPFVGDWDGNGVDTAGIIRDGDWHLVNAHRGGRSDVAFTYGRVSRGDLPVTGDWDGDDDTNVAVLRDGTWHMRAIHAGGAADWSHTWTP